MSIMVVEKEFKLIGLKGTGEFVNFGNEVPLLAKRLLSRKSEILNPIESEIALFEPKKDEGHKVGHYYVGLIISEKIYEVPTGMDYMETNNSYITTRGSISKLEELYLSLLNWAVEQSYKRDLSSYIVETYHPIGEVEEEVQIYLPIQT